MTALRILHVEDEPDIREVVEVSLGLDPEFVTRSCGSGREALALAADWPPDIILLDVMMPGMDGPATLVKLQDNTKTADIPVVFMTARAQTREIELFRSLGAAGVIPKPFDPMTLAASVRAYARPANGQLVEMRETFLRRVSSDAAALGKFRSALKDGTVTPATLARIKEIAHGLAGAGGIFGFIEIGDAAAVLEEAVNAELNDSGTIAEIAWAMDFLFAGIAANSWLQKAQFQIEE
jgi:DNA-binding response OmpR family regulator